MTVDQLYAIPSLFVEPANLSVTSRCVNRLFGTDLRCVTSLSGSPLTSVEHSVPKYGFESEASRSRPGPIATSARRDDEGSCAIVTGKRPGATAGYSFEPVGTESPQLLLLPPKFVSALAVKVPRALIVPPPL